jgi:hypothetical protein
VRHHHDATARTESTSTLNGSTFAKLIVPRSKRNQPPRKINLRVITTRHKSHHSDSFPPAKGHGVGSGRVLTARRSTPLCWVLVEQIPAQLPPQVAPVALWPHVRTLSRSRRQAVSTTSRRGRHDHQHTKIRERPSVVRLPCDFGKPLGMPDRPISFAGWRLPAKAGDCGDAPAVAARRNQPKQPCSPLLAHGRRNNREVRSPRASPAPLARPRTASPVPPPVQPTSRCFQGPLDCVFIFGSAVSALLPGP